MNKLLNKQKDDWTNKSKEPAMSEMQYDQIEIGTSSKRTITIDSYSIADGQFYTVKAGEDLTIIVDNSRFKEKIEELESYIQRLTNERQQNEAAVHEYNFNHRRW